MLPDEVNGADVRFRYRTSVHQRDAARAAAADVRRELFKHGAAVVKIEEQVVPDVRARAAEVVDAKTTADKLLVFWKSKSIEVDDEQRSRVFAKLEELERATA